MITTRSVVLSGCLVLAAVTIAARPGEARVPQSAAARVEQVRTRITVLLPDEETEITLDGEKVNGRGTSRRFQTPRADRGSTRRHTITATWQPNSYTTMTRTKTVTIRAGEPVTVDLTVDDPEDRVRVIYVPTPNDVAQEMVDLAAVRPGDVVYEPGCGDARITIAAIRSGARRGICIDIDPERAEESRANVKAAGFAEVIDVRLGDALDLDDLSDVTVVLLYMGDHFNMLIRPVLWRDLAVGSRIVSHRFTMGDWAPDRTVTVHSEDGGQYELHLWTITEEVKRRASPPSAQGLQQ